MWAGGISQLTASHRTGVSPLIALGRSDRSSPG